MTALTVVVVFRTRNHVVLLCVEEVGCCRADRYHHNGPNEERGLRKSVCTDQAHDQANQQCYRTIPKLRPLSVWQRVNVLAQRFNKTRNVEARREDVRKEENDANRTAKLWP